MPTESSLFTGSTPHTARAAWNKRSTYPCVCWLAEVMKTFKNGLVLYWRIIKNYKLSGILTIDGFPFFGLDKLNIVSLLLCKMYLESCPDLLHWRNLWHFHLFSYVLFYYHNTVQMQNSESLSIKELNLRSFR